MKKRKELDALVNGSKQGSGARVKNGRHELLRNESESSEIEEFSLTQNTAARKRTRCHCCSMCWPVCSAFLLVLCICFVVVLVWMNIQLKNEVYQLQNHLHEVQVTVKDIPSRVDSLTEDQKSLQKSLSGLTTKGDGDVPQLRSAVSALSSQISSINATLIPLKQSPALASQSTIQELQSHYDQLSHNFADIGSRVAAVEKEQEQQQQQLSQLVTSLLSSTPSPANRSSSDSSSAGHLQAMKEIQRLTTELGHVNSSFREQLNQFMAQRSAQQSLLVNLYNQTLSLDSRLTALQQKWTSSDSALPPTLHAAIMQAIDTQLMSHLQDASQSDFNNSLSSAVSDMKQIFDTRMSTLELRDVNLTKIIASLAVELNYTKDALNHATSNITDSVQLLAHTTESIAVRLQAVEEVVDVLQSGVLKPKPSTSGTKPSTSPSTFTPLPAPAAQPTAIAPMASSDGKVGTLLPVPIHSNTSNTNDVNTDGGDAFARDHQGILSPTSRRRLPPGHRTNGRATERYANDQTDQQIE